MKILKLALSFLISSAFLETLDAQFCIEDIQEIYTAEASVNDTTARRNYVLCSRRIFEVGTLDHNFDLQGDNLNPPLPIRSNMTIRCGDTGNRANLCYITKGDLHVDATPYRGISDTAVEGVRIEGLTFMGAHKYSTWATKPGDITFSDCEWREHTKSVVPIMLDYFDGSSTKLSVTFENCDFMENKFFGWGSHTSLIYANGPQNSLNLTGTRFDMNDMLHNNSLATTNSFLIETLGPLTMERTCFTSNSVGVSSVAVFGNSFTNVDNFEGNSTGELCDFASVFETLEQFDTMSPLCVAAGSASCLAGGTDSPSTSPTLAPPAEGTGSPSIVNPTASPTTASPTITPAPTIIGEPEVDFVFPTGPPSGSAGTWLQGCGVSTIVVVVAYAVLFA